MATTPPPPRRRGWAGIPLGILIALIGLVLAAGGAWLAALGGSLYYLLVGLALIVSGVFVAILALGWTFLTNGYPIVYCPPSCSEGAPLTDIAHLGSLALGPAAAAAAILALWRRRARVGWVLPAIALALVFATLVALSKAAVPY